MIGLFLIGLDAFQGPAAVSQGSSAPVSVAAPKSSPSGTTGFRLEMGTDGHVMNCIITASSGDRKLDEKTCALLRHAKIPLKKAGRVVLPTGETDDHIGRDIANSPNQ